MAKKKAIVENPNQVRIENINDLAVAISQVEGKKEQVNIAQIKEILGAIPIVYRKYVTAEGYKSIPFKIKQFWRLLTRDERWNYDVDETLNGMRFVITIDAEYSKYEPIMNDGKTN